MESLYIRTTSRHCAASGKNLSPTQTVKGVASFLLFCRFKTTRGNSSALNGAGGEFECEFKTSSLNYEFCNLIQFLMIIYNTFTLSHFKSTPALTSREKISETYTRVWLYREAGKAYSISIQTVNKSTKCSSNVCLDSQVRPSDRRTDSPTWLRKTVDFGVSGYLS